MTTPIMSIMGNVINRFEKLRNDTPEMHQHYVDAGLIGRGICVNPDLSQFRGPRSVFGDDRCIVVWESFMNYLWALGYFFLVLQEEINRRELEETWNGELLIDTALLQNALTLYNWALTIKQGFKPWPVGLPNPIEHSRITSQEKAFCGNANAIFTFAMSYLLYHEFAHLSCHHDDIAKLYSARETRTLTEDELFSIRSAENEADLFALEMLQKIDDDEQFRINSALGVTTAVVSMLFAERSMESVQKASHPDTDERIRRAVTFFRFEERKHSDYMYHLACNACLLFFQRNSIPWDDYEFENIEDYFDKILAVFDRYKLERTDL